VPEDRLWHRRRAEPLAREEHRAQVVPGRVRPGRSSGSGACASAPSRAIERYQIKARGPDAEAATLSGGNIQKIVLAREFAGRLKALIAASPTRGLDVSAVETVHTHLLDAAERGVGVLLISEDLDEILALADRILVMYEGRLTEVRDRDDLHEIAVLMAGGAP